MTHGRAPSQIYDETHSTSKLIAQVMENNKKLHRSQRAGGEMPGTRNKAMSAETSRRDKSGRGFEAVIDNFEGTVSQQHAHVNSIETLAMQLDLHSGATSLHSGRPFVNDAAAHLDTPDARDELCGDTRLGYGGTHPISPEFVFNAKRREALEFGLVDVDGTISDVCEAQMSPETYWGHGNGSWRPAYLESRPTFWINKSLEVTNIFDMPLTRPLQGTVNPGKELAKLFVENEILERNIRAGLPNQPISDSELVINQNVYTRMRSLATDRDERMRKQEQMMTTNLKSHDIMSVATADAAALNGDVTGARTNDDGTPTYTIKTVAMTTRIADETNRLYSLVIQPWHTRTDMHLQTMATILRNEGCLDVDAPEWDRWWVRKREFDKRFYAVKSDLAKYHIRLLRTCFLSIKDAETLPHGYKMMYKAVERGVKANGDSASIAFNSRRYSGRQMMCNDRQVWGNLQEWLRGVFVDDCRIDGRDRRLMDEMYATAQLNEKLHQHTRYDIALKNAHGARVSTAGICTALSPTRT